MSFYITVALLCLVGFAIFIFSDEGKASSKAGPWHTAKTSDDLKEVSEKLDAIMTHFGITVESSKAKRYDFLKEKLSEVLMKENTHGAKELTIDLLQKASGGDYEECKEVVETSGLWSPFDLEIDRYGTGF